MTTQQFSDLRQDCDAVLEKTTRGGIPGVVAAVTDRDGTIYEGTAGTRELGGEQPMTQDSVFAIFSTTKAIAGTCCLQLVESGDLDLDAPAKDYAPGLADVQVLDGLESDGSPRLRAPATDPTTRQLLVHTAGFGYDFFNERYAALAKDHGQPSPIAATRESLRTPLLFDPGSQWEYGTNIDWAGQVVEGITGQRLGEVMAERVFEPCGMTSTAFSLTPEMRERKVTMHQRTDGGGLRATEFELPPDPEVHMGGHGLWGTTEDYIRFIRMWLNDGQGEHGQVLRPETAAMAAQDHLGGMKIKALPGVNPALSNDAEFFPDMPKSWGLTFMINDQQAPTGRPAGALAWAGLANLYYWIDRDNGVGGFWATQLFPFADPASVGGYLDLEAAVYRNL